MGRQQNPAADGIKLGQPDGAGVVATVTAQTGLSGERWVGRCGGRG